jgi:hypothetical protein
LSNLAINSYQIALNTMKNAPLAINVRIDSCRLTKETLKNAKAAADSLNNARCAMKLMGVSNVNKATKIDSPFAGRKFGEK